MPVDYKKDYHPHWKSISRFIRFTRAQGKCERCAAANYEPHPVTGSKVVLTVAHLDRRRENNRWWNLLALCQKCHLDHDRQSNLHSMKYGKNHQRDQMNLFTP